jgi:apolipoprotein N-acyltransferase
MQLAVAAFRAVEQRRFVVRASTAGLSAVIDPLGRVTVSTEMFERGTLVGRISASRESTLYARGGDWFAVLCVALSLLAVVVGRRQE